MTSTFASPFDLSYQRHQRQGPNPYPTEVSHPDRLRSVPLFLSPQNLVHPNEPPISDLLYAGFLEHLGRCIYGGIVDDYRNPSPEALLEVQDEGDERTKGSLGWRKDVKALLAKDGELEVPMMRWPGGNFVSNYHWQDGIGPIGDRPKRIELAWLSDDPNTFGTDEFIDWCRATKIEPFICLNMGTGSLEEALAWVEYCNGTGDSHWAKLRRKNTGRDEPHNVKYWGLGNEMWGPWQVGNLDATEYTRRAKAWAHGLKLVDPSVKLISCGHTGAADWDREVLATLVGYVDMHSIHYYSMVNHDKLGAPGFMYEKNVFGPVAAENYINVCQSLIDLANVERSLLDLRPRNVKICFDEWNVWDKAKGNAKNGLEQWYDYTDMLGFVAWLNILVRKHKEVAIACLAQSVNVIAPIMTRPEGICKQTTYYPLKLFSTYMKGGQLLATPNQPDVYKGPTYPAHIQMMEMKPAYIDIVAIIVDSSIRVSILNRHPTADWQAKYVFDGFEVDSMEIHEMYSDDLDASNTFEHPNDVVPHITKLTGDEWRQRRSWTVRKHSWSFFVIQGK